MIKDIDALVCIKNNAAKLYCNVYSTYTDRKPEFVFFGEERKTFLKRRKKNIFGEERKHF